MVWMVVALALLLVLSLGVLAAMVVSSRREFLRLTDVFPCRLRLAHGLLPGVRRRWKGRPVRAAWAHDVLLVRAGPLSVTTRSFAVCTVEGAAREVSPRDVQGLGPEPMVLRLRLDDGDVVELAAPGAARELFVGPYLAACVDNDDKPTRRRPPHQSRVDPD